MPAIIISSFGGEIPRVSPRLLESNQASNAINCQLERGSLEPLPGPLKICDLDKEARTIFKHKQDGWLAWEKEARVIKSSVIDASGDRPLGLLFITGDRDYPTQYLLAAKQGGLAFPGQRKRQKSA